MSLFNNSFDTMFSSLGTDSVVTDNEEEVALKPAIVGTSDKELSNWFIRERVLQPNTKDDTGEDAPPMMDIPSQKVLSEVMRVYGVNALIYLKDVGFDWDLFNQQYGNLDMITANSGDISLGVGIDTSFIAPSDNVNQFIAEDVLQNQAIEDATKEQQNKEDIATASILGTNVKSGLIYAAFGIGTLLLILNNKWGK